MAQMRVNFFSEVLGMNTSMTVVLPQLHRKHVGPDQFEIKRFYGPHPTLFLLHGGYDDDTMWTRRTSVERYADQLGLAVVMPQVQLSFYTDMAYGGRYWTFLSEELPLIARSFFPLSDKREDNFVAGLSMGGYGAFKWALRKPEMFAAAASMSGAVDVASLADSDMTMMQAVFGGRDVKGTEDDLFHLLGKLRAEGKEIPSLYQCCGQEDFVYADNLKFRDACAGLPNYSFVEGPGAHNWNYWESAIQKVLKWLPVRER